MLVNNGSEKEKRGRMSAPQRREFILARAKRVFARLSYREASTGQLASESEVTEPMLYKHFGSKKGLFLAVLEQFGSHFLEIFHSRVLAAERDDPLKALQDLGLEYRQAVKADPDILKVLFQSFAEANNDPDIARAARHNNLAARVVIHDFLERAREKGLLEEGLNLEAATWGYMGIAYVIQISLMLDLDEELDESLLLEINRLWVEALRPKNR